MIYRKIHTEMLAAVGLINIDSVDYCGINLRGGASGESRFEWCSNQTGPGLCIRARVSTVPQHVLGGMVWAALRFH